ncbi:glucose/arabinose dehydrogenase [Nocardioides thalensis]|uniref:Glucose/arabinose dehydrogenase n=1 Tax=Nocardioides thalensis TaxID=1914755 RepID=A0A853C3N9_9ACTN|nr:PQQ-dependent sugar dehydrogenase [Nocardioides thalensis]NYJ01817.1 glucose/arabinose dehydrogenase [Nocardioides thalensis]
MRSGRLSTVLAVLVLTCLGGRADAVPTEAEGDPGRTDLPGFRVTTVADGLAIPWDVQSIGGGRLLFTERDSRSITLIDADRELHPVEIDNGSLWSSGETGLMGLEVDPGFDKNRRIYTCSGWTKNDGSHDIRVHAWRLSEDLGSATRTETLVAGLPTTSGRHGGCRLLVLRDGSLLVGTGDAAQTENPQNRNSLGGKTLRLDRMTGAPWPRNKWADEKGRQRYVFTYGHRNVQGLAQRADGTLWSAEHGTYRDDEINRLGNGRNYGWQPGPGYDESPPMTDFSLPGKQYGARWSSGEPTIATSGATFVAGKEWGVLRGTMAVGVLAGSRLMFVKFSADGKLRWTKAPAALKEFGRLRSVTRVGNALLVTTSNGSNDKILRITPQP